MATKNNSALYREIREKTDEIVERSSGPGAGGISVGAGRVFEIGGELSENSQF